MPVEIQKAGPNQQGREVTLLTFKRATQSQAGILSTFHIIPSSLTQIKTKSVYVEIMCHMHTVVREY